MRAKINTKFSEGFLLTEEHIVKIEDIIRKRISPSDQNMEMKYEVHRVDDAVITYKDNQFFSFEENSKYEKVKELKISSTSNVGYL